MVNNLSSLSCEWTNFALIIFKPYLIAPMFSKPLKRLNKKRSTLTYKAESYITPPVILKTWGAAYFGFLMLSVWEEEISTVVLIMEDKVSHQLITSSHELCSDDFKAYLTATMVSKPFKSWNKKRSTLTYEAKS